MQSGQWEDKKTNKHTIGDMMLRYLNVVTPTKQAKTKRQEGYEGCSVTDT